MTSRRSSGSMRAESAVEPTRSENITVTWRRSAVSWGFGSVRRRAAGVAGAAPASSRDRAQHFPPMPERDADLFEVLIGQIAEDRDIDVVLGKALRVLGHAELFEPVRNLLHRGLSRVMRRVQFAYRFRCGASQSRLAWSAAPQHRSPEPCASSPRRHRR